MAGHRSGRLSFLLPLSSREISVVLWTVVEPARRFPPPWSVEEQEACFVVRDHSGQALIKGTAVLQDYLPIGPYLPMRTPHEQAAPHGGRFRPRYESQAAAQHPRRHRAQNQRGADPRSGRRVARKRKA